MNDRVASLKSSLFAASCCIASMRASSLCERSSGNDQHMAIISVVSVRGAVFPTRLSDERLLVFSLRLLPHTRGAGETEPGNGTISSSAPRDGCRSISCSGLDLNVSEVAGLNSKRAAVAAHGGAEPRLRGKPQPGVRRKAFAAFVERAIEHQEFAAVRKFDGKQVFGAQCSIRTSSRLSLNSGAISTPGGLARICKPPLGRSGAPLCDLPDRTARA
jgi:hypothetical protein